VVAQDVDPPQIAALADQLIDREFAVLVHNPNLATAGASRSHLQTMRVLA
jgi:hypothetical protein